MIPISSGEWNAKIYNSQLVDIEDMKGELVKSTYVSCNALFNKGGRKVVTMLASGQVYMEVLNKVIKDTLRMANTHNILEFNRCDARFLVQETINPGEKLHMLCSHVVNACKHVYHEYRHYIHLMYMLEKLCNETYWPPCHKPMISPNLEKKRNTKGCHVSTRIHTEMDIREPNKSKRCSVGGIPGHTKKICPHCVGLNQQH
ncbi:hypothetical protein JHK85_007435 [Glycine max]|uniref:Uncharacterized protein n=1 Tax=Glycine max TaxID=3847 RepID=A0A0R0KHS7_SOYBN|nr:hypothetical protein JHK85_007435 [Glycine max]KAG5072011.1 hypothetical protein JHK86_007222 [Glycine max]